MTRRMLPAIVAAAVLALLLGAAAPRADAVGFVDKQVQAGGLLIQNYIDKYGMAHQFVFPGKSMVKKGGGLPDETLMWPANPWTGRTMGPGTARGTYTYTLGAGGISYKLVMHFSSGGYTFRGAMPRWLKTQRDTASKQNLLLLQRYLEAYAFANGGLYPAADKVSPEVFTSPTFVWPLNAWTGQAMTVGPGPGDYQYTQKTVNNVVGAAYDLTTRLSNGDTYRLVQFPIGAPLLTAPGN